MSATTRERIVHSAWELVRENGLEGLTLRRLGAAVGVTAPAVYRHFPDKEALFQRLVDEANEELSRYLLAALGAKNARTRLEATVERYLAFARERRAEYEVLFFARGRRDLDVPPRGQRSRNFQLMRDRVAEAMAAGFVAPGDPAAVSVSIWALLHGLVSLQRQGRYGDDQRQFDAACRASVRHLFEGLKHRPPTVRSKRR